jgi:periplasmic divalent cation tolerance protein
MTETLIVLTNMPDAASAASLATRLVEQRVAACVNVLAPCRSVYRWQDTIEHAHEVPMLIKTTACRYAALEAAIRAEHPYELPEIVAVPVATGLAGYLGWVAAETAPARVAGDARTPPQATHGGGATNTDAGPKTDQS